MKKYIKTYQWLNNRLEQLSKWPELARLYKNAFLSTLETTTKLLDDGTTYVFTGDIPAMWLRDSSAQVRHYLHLVNEDSDMKRLISGLIERQFIFINYDPYANAFIEIPDKTVGHIEDLPTIKEMVWERKFELDSLMYPLWILDLYYQKSMDSKVFTKNVLNGFKTIIDVIEIEMNHHQLSSYWFMRPNDDPIHSPSNNGHGLKTNNETNLVWSAFRPSDDVCKYNFFIPGNQFVVLGLNIIAKYAEGELKLKAQNLAKTIEQAINKYGIINHPKYGKIYSYETDGFGNHNLMDDANIPSLLALPYLGYLKNDDPIYQNTRKFILSKDNPFYYEGKYAKGVGSPHTPNGYIWHIALISQALTTSNTNEKKQLLQMILKTHANTYQMHEGFNPDKPEEFTREWFSWANSLFAFFIDENIEIIDQLMVK